MLPKMDGRQKLRMRRLKMAMFSYAMWLSLAVFAFVTGNISREVMLVVIGGIGLTNVYFYAMIRSGLNKRLTDPSMTIQQLVIAFSWAIVLMMASSEVEAPVTMLRVYCSCPGVSAMMNLRRSVVK